MSTHGRTALSVLGLILLPVVVGIYFLASNAPRDWALHWTAPTSVVTAASNGDYAAVNARNGLDVVWQDPRSALYLSRTDASGLRLRPDIALRGSVASSAQSITMAHSGADDVVLWREDTNNVSRLRAAIVAPSGHILYRTLASGDAPLEHPKAFTVGQRVDVVFSWQRGTYNIYLAGITPTGAVSRPVQLTHVSSYAFNPHAAVDGADHIQMMYMETCCGGSAMYMMRAQYTLAGAPLGAPQRIERINSVSAGNTSSATPDRWGLDVEPAHGDVMAAWIDDEGLRDATWGPGSTRPLDSHLLFSGIASPVVALAISRLPAVDGGPVSVVWLQSSETSTILDTVNLNGAALPAGDVERVAYEGALDDQPEPILLRGEPAVVWQAEQSGGHATIETSRFSPATVQAPSPAEQFGLGVANPLGAIAILIFGGVGLGVLIAAANILIILALVLVYIVAFRFADRRWKWSAFGVVVSALVYVLLVPLGAPSPPVLFLTSFAGLAGVLALAGALLFTVLLNQLLLRRLDDVYRAAIMATCTLFFLGFLQALVFVQGQLGRI